MSGIDEAIARRSLLDRRAGDEEFGRVAEMLPLCLASERAAVRDFAGNLRWTTCRMKPFASSRFDNAINNGREQTLHCFLGLHPCPGTQSTRDTCHRVRGMQMPLRRVATFEPVPYLTRRVDVRDENMLTLPAEPVPAVLPLKIRLPLTVML